MSITDREPIQSTTIGESVVSIDRLQLSRGAVFQVCMMWRQPGPGPEYFRPSLTDYYDAHELELARAIAGAAGEAITASPSVCPDIRQVARDLKRRRPDLAPLTRTAGGAVLLDSPADER